MSNFNGIIRLFLNGRRTNASHLLSKFVVCLSCTRINQFAKGMVHCKHFPLFSSFPNRGSKVSDIRDNPTTKPMLVSPILWLNCVRFLSLRVAVCVGSC